ncbi:flavodoxin domain-containing protein [Sedimentitalea sp. JM2-8]|uniref:Flavodoxin domain-containing protein n=1 Tax=Sedimentitalea xiamensis TaxID=3050037 RepID=A0ABT7FIK5_9RHOB|nr:flavodoxin domain-containing protein [Sedimentitalea xiamensis]MDK3074964.1 flavodoxin domain-containing protein [Sedimentitalea xiamensis]
MKVLICYASTEGQTRKIARFCADTLFAQGHSAEVLPVALADPIDLAVFDAVIVAGSVHLGRLQAELSDFVTAHGEMLNGMPTLFLVVSLAAAGQDEGDRRDLDGIASDFCDRAGWSPGATHHLAGAFRFSEYDFFKSLAMRYVASQHGQTVDPHADKEYTDWSALSDLLRDWPAPKAGAG